MNNIGPFYDILRHQQRKQQDDENSARLAQSYSMHDSTGWGEFSDDAVVDFGLTFVEEPIVTYGYAIDGDDLIDTRFPRSFGFVYKWRQDQYGYYTGAWVAFCVDDQSPYVVTSQAASPNYTLHHYFTYTGIAYKDLPHHLLDD